jgi:Protein of unknown function (DUF664)
VSEPRRDLADVRELLLGYLDHYRSVVETKTTGMTERDLRGSRLPSGWTPVELVKHLVFMERRWLRWGFAAEQIADPWDDDGDDGRWHVGEEESLSDLVARLHEGGRRTRRIVESASLSDLGATGGRFSDDDVPPTLAWILFHVLQEYARHAGHLDIARELADGTTGE